MSTIHRSTRLAAATLVAGCTVGLAGCGQALGALGDILAAPGADGGVVTVEVQQVRPANQDVVVRTQEGQQGPVLYDANTVVVYQDQQYPVTALERGDIVDMRVHQVEQGYYTDLIQVRTPVQERTGASGAPAGGVYQVEGTIGTIDIAGSRFTLNLTQGGTIEVVIPQGAPAADLDRLRQHLPGDYLRAEVRPLADQRAELVRFGWA